MNSSEQMRKFNKFLRRYRNKTKRRNKTPIEPKIAGGEQAYDAQTSFNEQQYERDKLMRRRGYVSALADIIRQLLERLQREIE